VALGRWRKKAGILAAGCGQDKLAFDSLLQNQSAPATMKRWR
jgi:hypothetical protein